MDTGKLLRGSTAVKHSTNYKKKKKNIFFI